MEPFGATETPSFSGQNSIQTRLSMATSSPIFDAKMLEDACLLHTRHSYMPIIINIYRIYLVKHENHWLFVDHNDSSRNPTRIAFARHLPRGQKPHKSV